MLYAYRIVVTSSRKIEKACVTGVALRVIVGNQGPAHTTMGSPASLSVNVTARTLDQQVARVPPGAFRSVQLVCGLPTDMHSRRCHDALTGGECPRWDSNPHWVDFKSTASADWATGAGSSRCQSTVRQGPVLPGRAPRGESSARRVAGARPRPGQSWIAADEPVYLFGTLSSPPTGPFPGIVVV